MVRTHPALGPYLNRLARTYGSTFLDSDPIGEVRRFRSHDDLEVAAFLAAGLAFGRVETVLDRLRRLWVRLDHAPARTVDGWTAQDAGRLEGLQHRWVRDTDLALVLGALGRARRRHGSLKRLFLDGYDADARDLSGALSRFVVALRREVRMGTVRGPVAPERLPYGVRGFFSDPARGGACKRLNLFLRWMVRRDDGVDLGLFSPVRPRQLVVPLDTHVSRISRYLGLSRRRTVDWKMAAEVTDGLRRWDAEDPVRFDFALSRLGILDACPRRVDRARCAACSLMAVCTLGRKGVV
jgi:uncharacterized protein (TIGR02757 family)